MKTLVILSALLAVASSYRYTKCKLAHTLQRNGMDGYQGHSLADWVCLVQYESGYDTGVIGRNRKDGVVVSSDYGLFQINSYWWCDDHQTQNTRNGCSRNCNDFLDNDISNDIACVKRVVRDAQGINAWRGWKNNCKNQDLRHFLAECNL